MKTKKVSNECQRCGIEHPSEDIAEATHDAMDNVRQYLANRVNLALMKIEIPGQKRPAQTT